MNFQEAAAAFSSGGLLAYPTEAVFGVGCDPDNDVALNRLLTLKQRDPRKGLILLASDFSLLLPYVDMAKITPAIKQNILARWPNGVTQVLPKNPLLSPLLCGEFDSIAVRVTNQPDVVELCRHVDKPIVSTSANLSGKEPAAKWEDLDPRLIEHLDYVIKGNTLGFDKPSTIVDAISGQQYR